MYRGLMHSPPTPNEVLVLKALDASRRYDKLCAVRNRLPKDMQEYFDISVPYMEKHAAIDAVVERMREDFPNDEEPEGSPTSGSSTD